MSGKQSIHHVNGVDLNVLDMGKGTPTLLFLHYWGGSVRSWRPVMEALSQTQRCVAIDFRGWGQSSRDTTDYRLDTLADDVIGVTHDLGLNFSLIGHSMGGKVAQLVAARRPAGLKRLILMAPAPPTPIELSDTQRQAMIASYQTREAMSGVIAAIPLSDARREQIIEDALSGSPEAKRAWPEQGTREDIKNQASKINVPVRVIVGTADVVEPEASLRAAFGKAIPGTRFTVLSCLSHMAPLEATGEVAEAIRAAQAD